MQVGHGRFDAYTETMQPSDGMYKRGDKLCIDGFSVPDGWRLVPEEPTGEMSLKGFDAYQDTFGTYLTRMEAAYKAMLAAAPQPPKENER